MGFRFPRTGPSARRAIGAALLWGTFGIAILTSLVSTWWWVNGGFFSVYSRDEPPHSDPTPDAPVLHTSLYIFAGHGWIIIAGVRELDTGAWETRIWTPASHLASIPEVLRVDRSVGPGPEWHLEAWLRAGVLSAAAAGCATLILATTIICWYRRRREPGRCHACGYDLTGNTSGRCPECGAVAVYDRNRVV